MYDPQTAQALADAVNTMNVNIRFSRKDFSKFFGLAVLANAVSFSAIVGFAGYISEKAKQKREKNNSNLKEQQ